MNIKDLRTKKNFTQSEFAAQIGVVGVTYARYERESNYPNDVLEKISKKFKIDIEELRRDNSAKKVNTKGFDVYAVKHLMERIINNRLVDALAKKSNIVAEPTTPYNMELPDSIEECHYAINVLLDKIVASDTEIDNLNEQLGLLKDNLALHKKK